MQDLDETCSTLGIFVEPSSSAKLKGEIVDYTFIKKYLHQALLDMTIHWHLSIYSMDGQHSFNGWLDVHDIQ